MRGKYRGPSISSTRRPLEKSPTPLRLIASRFLSLGNDSDVEVAVMFAFPIVPRCYWCNFGSPLARRSGGGAREPILRRSCRAWRTFSGDKCKRGPAAALLVGSQLPASQRRQNPPRLVVLHR